MARPHVLRDYPELKQKELIGANRDGEKMSRKAGEVQRRLGALPKREEVKETLLAAMNQTSSMGNFHFYLEERGYQFYLRGKNYGVEVTHEDGSTKKYRFSTLGVHDQFEQFSELVTRSEHETGKQDFAGEKENKDPEVEAKRAREMDEREIDDTLKEVPERDAGQKGENAEPATNSERKKKRKQRDERQDRDVRSKATESGKSESDNQGYVNKDSNTDLKNNPSQQNPKVRNTDQSQNSEDEMRLKDVMGIRETLAEKRKANTATKDDVRKAAEAAGRSAEAQVKMEMGRTAEATAKRTAKQVQDEFERMTAKQKESAKHMPKQKK